MSSARKRAAIQKANDEADSLRQRLMLAEHHGNVMQVFAEVAAQRSDAMTKALKGIAALRTKHPKDPIATANEALQIADAALMGSNDRVVGLDASAACGESHTNAGLCHGDGGHDATE